MRPFRNKGLEGDLLFARLDKSDPPLWLRQSLAEELGKIEARFSPVVRVEQVINAPLGCGSHGCVFALEDGRVLKVTSDPDEGPASERIRILQEQGRRFKGHSILETTAKVDAVFRFRRTTKVYQESVPIYGIVREQVGEAGQGIPVELGCDLDFYTDGWDAWACAEGRPGRVVGVAMARVGLSFLSSGVGVSKKLGAMLGGLWDDGYPLMDPHQCNVALREKSVGPGSRRGQIVVFDFGGGASCPLGHFVHPQDVVHNKARRPPVEIPFL